MINTHPPRIDHKGVPYRLMRQYLKLPLDRFLSALEKDDVGLMRALLRSHVDPNFLLSEKTKPERRPEGGWNNTGKSLLHHAVLEEKIAAVMVLLEHGADPNASMYFGETPLHYAAMVKNETILALLVTHGGDTSKTIMSRSTYIEDNPYTPDVLETFRSYNDRREFDPTAHQEWLAQWQRETIGQEVEGLGGARKSLPRKM